MRRECKGTILQLVFMLTSRMVLIRREIYLDSHFNCICISTIDNVWAPHRFLEIHRKGGLREDRRRQGEDQNLHMPSAASFLKKVGLDTFTGKLGSNWLACCHTTQIAWGENYTYKSSQIPSLQIFGGKSLLLATHYYEHWVGHDTEASWGQLASA